MIETIETFKFQSNQPGPHLVFTGRVHGNEPCGEMALKRLIEKLAEHEITLKKGRVTLMPCCNPEATLINKRFVDVNLNRIISTDLVEENFEAYEAKLAPQIMSAIDTCDAYIDLHSFTENMEPVTICIDNQNEQSQALAQVCGIKRIECDSPLLTKPGAQMTIHYARHKHKPAVLVECGQHDDPHAVEIAYHAILNILVHFGMIEGKAATPIHHQFLVVRSAIYNDPGQKLIFPLMEQDYIKAGDPLFKTEHGDIIHAHEGGLLFMRNPNTPEGEEYAYVCEAYDDWP